jgi:hypothetical protein
VSETRLDGFFYEGDARTHRFEENLTMTKRPNATGAIDALLTTSTDAIVSCAGAECDTPREKLLAPFVDAISAARRTLAELPAFHPHRPALAFAIQRSEMKVDFLRTASSAHVEVVLASALSLPNEATDDDFDSDS